MMPLNVRNFIVLSYASLVLSIFELFLYRINTTHALSALEIGAVNLVAAGMITLYGLVIALAGWGRRDWARWLMLILFAFGLLFDLLSLPETLQTGGLADVLSWIESILQGTALYLIFTGDAKTWFRTETAVTS